MNFPFGTHSGTRRIGSYHLFGTDFRKSDIIFDVRRGGRVDDCARLENVFTREGNGGSNPFLSAEKQSRFGTVFIPVKDID